MGAEFWSRLAALCSALFSEKELTGVQEPRKRAKVVPKNDQSVLVMSSSSRMGAVRLSEDLGIGRLQLLTCYPGSQLVTA